jgi:hypothetical protein
MAPPPPITDFTSHFICKRELLQTGGRLWLELGVAIIRLKQIYCLKNMIIWSFILILGIVHTSEIEEGKNMAGTINCYYFICNVF